MVLFLFSFTVFLKLQFLVPFSNCFEEKNRPSWTLSSGSVWPASKENQLANHQFILPRMRYTAGKDKTSTAYVAETVSKLKAISKTKENCQRRARVGFIYTRLRIDMSP